MKFKKIETLLKSRRTIIICEGPDCQWIGDGSAFYPCYKYPHLDEKTLPVLMDIPEDKIDKYTISVKGLPKNVSFMDAVENENVVSRGNFEFVIDGMHLEPIETSQGMVFISTKYLKPYSDEKEGVQLFERINTAGAPYIAVKKGFVLLGIITPINIIDEKFISIIEGIVNSSKIALQNSKSKDDGHYGKLYE